MKKLIVVIGLVLASAMPLAASARTDVHIGIGLPLYFEPEPVYVEHHYYTPYWYPRAHVYHHRHHGHHKHHKHRGHHKHHRRHRHGDD